MPHLTPLPSTERLMLLLSPSCPFSPTMHAAATVVLLPMLVLAATMLSYLVDRRPERWSARLESATWRREGSREVGRNHAHAGERGAHVCMCVCVFGEAPVSRELAALSIAAGLGRYVVMPLLWHRSRRFSDLACVVPPHLFHPDAQASLAETAPLTPYFPPLAVPSIAYAGALTSRLTSPYDATSATLAQ